jgi:glycosyltransferase involved in cell wall biosynthesis
MRDKSHDPPATIVVPTLPGAHRDYLEVTLASVVPQARKAGAEVVVVSDGGDGPTATVAERHGARVVALPARRGANAARNAGIREARGELIVLIDADVEAPAGWLEALLAGAAGAPEREVFGGPIHARLEGGLARGCGREPPPITTLDFGPHDRDVPHVWSANMMVRRGAVERVGYFDETLLGRGEEEEWLHRFREAGGLCRYLAGATIIHRRCGRDARLRSLTVAAYGQGRASRRSDVRMGKPRPIRAELRVLAGCAWHTVYRRCPFGIVMGARAAGGLREAFAQRRARYLSSAR